MNRYFTIMIIPEREKGVKSFRIPRIIFHAVALICVIFIFLLGILSYDYWKILRQVYENKHLTIKNRQLEEQIQLIQMKFNTLTEGLKRIHTFEKKLRVITGIDEKGVIEGGPLIDESNNSQESSFFDTNKLDQLGDEDFIKDTPEYKKMKGLYEQKLAFAFGLQTGYAFTKEWSELTKQSFSMAEHFASFDFKFDILQNYIAKLEVNINELDQYLLDKDSFLKSTPTLLPTRGWVTSYYGPRNSPYSGRLKMHEGLDIGAKIGSPIVAPANGFVTYTGTKPGFGVLVQIDHGYGVETIYAHANKSFVSKGQTVARGDLIAAVGNTGYSTGPHVHYEIRVNGIAVDPLYYILD